MGKQSRSIRRAFVDWSEAFLGLAAAGLVFAAPYVIQAIFGLRSSLSTFFIADKNVTSGISFGLLSVGVLLSVSRKAIETKMLGQFQRVDELAKLIDLSGNAQYENLSQTLTLYSQITNPYFESVKRKLITQLKFDLSPMALEGTSPPLPASVFTGEEHSALIAACGSYTKVRAIATLFDGDFDLQPTEEEKRFIEANQRLVESGGDFERLFVIESSQYWKTIARPSVLNHIGKNPRIPGRVVFVDTLKQVDPSLDRRVGDGFLIFGEIVAFLDQPSKDRFARGRIVTNGEVLAQLHRLYEDLRAYSYVIDVETHPMTGEQRVTPAGNG